MTEEQFRFDVVDRLARIETRLDDITDGRQLIRRHGGGWGAAAAAAVVAIAEGARALIGG